MYVIKKKEKNIYVNKAGSKNAYTKDIRKARKFSSYNSAWLDCCGNEHVVTLQDECR